MIDGHARSDQRHAGFGPGDKYRCVKLACQRPASRFDLGIAGARHSARGSQLTGIRLDEIGAAIELECATLGIDEHGLSKRPGGANHLF